MRDRRMQSIELVFHEEFPVRMLNDAVAHGNDLDLAQRRAIAHVVESDLRAAEKLEERRSLCGKTREHESPVAIDARSSLHRAVRIVRGHAGSVVAARQRYPFDTAVEMKRPRVIRTN